MSGRPQLRPWQSSDIGRVVLTARENGASWKELERTFAMSSRQLQRIAGRVSREKMSHCEGEMSRRQD
jgi:hypothetical protein